MIEHDDKILVHKRTQKDIWENLFEFYLLESTEQIKWNIEIVAQWLKEQFALQNADVVITLRVQKERLLKNETLDLAAYHAAYAITKTSLAWAKPDVMVMHPGPLNRGVEIDYKTRNNICSPFDDENIDDE